MGAAGHGRSGCGARDRTARGLVVHPRFSRKQLDARIQTPSMSYAFPDHLATQVIERWETLLGRHDTPAPPLPGDADLRHILSTAFFASLEREEGRNLRFVLCCAPDFSVLRDGLGESVPVVPISPPRPVSVDAIRALAPAVSPDNAAIL